MGLTEKEHKYIYPAVIMLFLILLSVVSYLYGVKECNDFHKEEENTDLFNIPGCIAISKEYNKNDSISIKPES